MYAQMKIVLLRHGKPQMPHFERMTGSEFRQWVVTYNSVSLDKDVPAPPSAITVSESCKVAICSTLNRSIESSTALGLESRVVIAPEFVEASLPSYDVLNLRFSEKFWLVFFRVMWFFGYSPNCESYSACKCRAKECANRLVEAAKESESVVFVGHGILNRLIAKQLLKDGWHGSTKISRQYWRFSVYEKPC